LKARASQIKDYLLTQPQRFFNTLVIGVYGGNPEWYELSVRDNNLLDADDLPFYMEGAIGILLLNGSEALFALDGQHRVAGIRRAVKENPALGNEEVSTIFVGHKKDAAGLARTRRLFTTLNRYAKPVSKKDSIAMDEDDIIAIVTRQLVDEYPLFHEKVSLVESKNLPITDNRSFTTIIALYDSLDVYLKPKGIKWSNFKKRRPSDDVIIDYYQRAVQFWNLMAEQFDWLRKYKNAASTDGIAEKYRNENGGYILFRPIGILLISRVIKSLVLTGKTIQAAITALAKAPLEISDEFWSGLLWDSINRRMITSPTNQFLGEKLLFYAVGGDLNQRYKSSVDDLKKQLAGILNKQIDEVVLPKYL
jgi:DNA sulfur modification protein DndB